MSNRRVGRILLASVLLLSFAGWAFAQSSGTQNPPPDNSSQAPPSGAAQQTPPPNTSQTPPPEENKKEKKKKKKDKDSQDVLNSDVFSDAVARSVLNDIRDGLEGHSYRLMESAFDSDKMDGYLSFEDALEAMFERYSEFRVHFEIAQSTTEGPKGVILVDIDMDEIPNVTNTNTHPQPQRRQGQVRFELERGKKGWKIVDFSPRNFFS